MSTKTVFGGPIKVKTLNGSGKEFEGSIYAWHDEHNSLIETGRYFHIDTLSVLDQKDCKTIILKKMSVKVTDGDAEEIITTYFQCGVNNNGIIMDDPEDLLAAPCPPLCGTGTS